MSREFSRYSLLALVSFIGQYKALVPRDFVLIWYVRFRPVMNLILSSKNHFRWFHPEESQGISTHRLQDKTKGATRAAPFLRP
jgi:hypothetical protein